MEGSLTDRGAVERAGTDNFWCSICQGPKSKSKDGMLQVATRDGSQLHTVCRSHVPDDHHENREDVVEHPVFHDSATKDDGSPVVIGKDEHVVEPNSDGVVRSLCYEDLLKLQ